MLVTEKKQLFAEVSAEDSATVSGGQTDLSFHLDDYIFYLGAGTLFGNPGLTSDEIQHGWENSIYGGSMTVGIGL
ncbi:hypothetical protein NUACC21_41170 [Scytonema sp. NUACC21]